MFHSFITLLFTSDKIINNICHRTHVLSEMMLIKSSLLDRTRVAIKSPYTVPVITIAAFVIVVLTLVFQFFH